MARKVTVHHPVLGVETRQNEGFAEALIEKGWRPGLVPAPEPASEPASSPPKPPAGPPALGPAGNRT